MQFRNLQNKLWTTAKEWATAADVEIYKKISEFNPFADKSCSWFDPWWMFGVKEGFDIVIGNPPYRQLQKLKNSIQFANYKYETYSKSADLYCLFYEKGVQLLKEKGTLNYITSNSWMRTKYGLALRKFFAEKTNPLQLVNFENSQVFDTAIVESNILITQKEKFTKQFRAVNIENDTDESILEYVNKNSIILTELDENGWIIGNDNSLSLKKQIEYNKKHNIKPKTITKDIEDFLDITTES